MVACREAGQTSPPPAPTPASAMPSYARHSHREGDQSTRSSARSPMGLTPGPAARAWPTRACRHFTRVGRAVLRRDGLVLEQGGELGHDVVRLERAHGRGGGGVAQVVERRERGAVRESGLRRHDGGVAAHAPRRDPDDVAGRSPELRRDDLDVAVGRRVEGRGRHGHVSLPESRSPSYSVTTAVPGLLRVGGGGAGPTSCRRWRRRSGPRCRRRRERRAPRWSSPSGRTAARWRASPAPSRPSGSARSS